LADNSLEIRKQYIRAIGLFYMTFRHEELLVAARKEMEVADHLLYVTYPMVKESKFLLSVASKVATSARIALQALLEYEKLGNNILIIRQVL